METVLGLVFVWRIVTASEDTSGAQLLSREDFVELSEIRVLAIGRSLETKCGLYESRLRQILASSEKRSALFTRVIKTLRGKKLPFKNHLVVLSELEQCQSVPDIVSEDINQKKEGGESENEALRRELSETRLAVERDRIHLGELEQRLKSKTAKSETEDRSTANTEIDKLRRTLEESEQSAERDRRRLIELEQEHERLLSEKLESLMVLDDAMRELNRARAELSAKEVLIDAVNESNRQNDVDNENLQGDLAKDFHDKERRLTANMQKEIDKLRRDLETARAEIKKAKEAIAKDKRFLSSRVEETITLYENFSPGAGRCFKYHLLFHQERSLTVGEVIAIAKLDSTEINTIRYNMDRGTKSRFAGIYKDFASRAHVNELHAKIAEELHICSGFADCRGGVCCQNCRVLNLTPGTQISYL